jgi:uncharacterized protein YgfB (UPF0149 family)
MTYRVIDSIIERSDKAICAAEAHGMAAGMLCVDNRIDSVAWLIEVFSEISEITWDERNVLTCLFERTQELLGSDSYEFDLFLPGDEYTLQEQAAALQSWCSGFLFGVGYASSSSDWPGESGEILQDIVEFSRLDTHVEGDDDENSIVEINEYIRAGVLLIQDELRDASQGEHLH